MKLSIFAKQAKKLVADNAPAILSSVAVAGALTTAYLVGKASFKAAEMIGNEGMSRSVSDPYIEPMNLQEKIGLVWKEYVPAAAVAALTVVSIIGSNHISTRRATAMASALTVSDRIFTEYKKAVVEKIGEKKETEVHDKVMDDQVRRYPQDQSIIVVGNGTHLCMDSRSNRQFYSTYEDVRSAVNDLNEKLHWETFVSLSDFYRLLKIETSEESDEVGWRIEDGNITIRYTSVLTTKNQPCLVLSYDIKPHTRYDKSY